MKRYSVALKVFLAAVLAAVLIVPGAPVVASAYSDTILADSPVRYYRFNETSGTTAEDFSGNSADGTYEGGVTLGYAGAIPGDIDSAVSLDGTSGNVSIPTTAIFTSHNFSIEAWIHPVARENNEMIIDAYSSDGGGKELLLSVYPGGFPLFSIQGVMLASEGLHYDEWNYVVISYDAAAQLAYLFINGRFRVYTTVPLYTGTNPSVDIGSTLGAWNLYEGGIDELALYDYALSTAQVAAHYEAAGFSLSTPTPGTPTPTNTPTPAPWTLATIPGTGQTYQVTYEASVGDGLQFSALSLLVVLSFIQLLVTLAKRR